jgi:hypothetical protein
VVVDDQVLTLQENPEEPDVPSKLNHRRFLVWMAGCRDLLGRQPAAY